MTNKPLVTVITPAYNCARFIGETVESVLDQDYENIKYIVIDDASTDNTIDILAGYDYGDEYNKLLVLQNERNKGEHDTINTGLKNVTGEYFVIVNADDALLPGAITTLVDFMEKHPSILCGYPDWESINEDGSPRLHIKSREYDFIYMIRHHTCLPSVGSIFRSTVIETVGYRDTSFPLVGDLDYWQRIGLSGKMARVPATLAKWRHREGQASGGKDDVQAMEHVNVMRKFYQMRIANPDLWAVRSEAMCWSYLVAAAVSKSKRQIIGCVLKGLASYPQILINIEFWSALIQRARYILRR